MGKMETQWRYNGDTSESWVRGRRKKSREIGRWVKNILMIYHICLLQIQDRCPSLKYNALCKCASKARDGNHSTSLLAKYCRYPTSHMSESFSYFKFLSQVKRAGQLVRYVQYPDASANPHFADIPLLTRR